MKKKKWKTVKDFKDVINDTYQVSYEGDVRYKKSKEHIHQKIANKKYHPYYAVYLKKNNGKSEWVLVHQLVASFFVKVPKKYKDGNLYDLVPDHLDNNGLNNHYENLEWKTRGENIKSAHEKKYIDNSGENHNGAIITLKQAEEICDLFDQYKSYDEILKEMNLPNTKQYRQLLVRIKNRKAWTCVSDKHPFDEKKIKYTPAQLETVEKLDNIKKMISDGYSNYEIVRTLWGSDISKSKLQTRSQTITKIRNNEIYKELM